MLFKYVVRQENEPDAKSSRFSSKAGYARGLYPNNLKNWEFGEEAPQNSHLERANIVGVQGASEDENFEEKPTLPKTNSSSCLGIYVFTSSLNLKGVPLVLFLQAP